MYAQNTSVPIGRTQDEIRKTLEKYKATAFAFGEQTGKALVQFDLQERRIKFVLPLPIRGVTRGGKRNYVMSEKEFDQNIRTKWRCLLLCIKSKLESVESGITTLEQEFMAHIVLPNGKTVGDLVLPEIAASYKENQLPNLLGFRG